ncbi:UDP-N-acetyl-D-mannosaminuronic acid transferase, WecB/TagA/CpsF family [Lachnospiraceae bacterium]|nr:UDP-N-acetyl-D-mannosaminuronic acid transferase, WecB/TagA/CpsF family [Lachnospiraceae bacterium]
MRAISVLGISLRDYSVREAMRRVTLFLNNGICNTVDFITHDDLLKATDSAELKRALEEMDLTVFTAGDILQAGNIISHSREREIESNLFLKGLLRKLAKEKRRIFIVSTESDKLKKFEDSLIGFEKELNIIGRCAVDETVGGSDAVVNEVNDSLPDALFLNLGTPDAEFFIQSGRMKLNTPLIVAMGDVCFRVTENGSVKKGGIGAFLLRHFFHSAAARYTQNMENEQGPSDENEVKF